MGKGTTPVISESSILGERSREWLQNILLNPSASSWVNQNSTDSLENYVVTSLRQSIKHLTDEFGSNIGRWTWGKIHQLTFQHILGSIKPLDLLFNRGPQPIGGDGDTIWASSSGYHSLNGSRTTSAPFRFIADLSNLNNCLGCLVPGQSGHPSSKHYSDNIDDWYEGLYHPMLYNRDAIDKNSDSTTWLEPDTL